MRIFRHFLSQRAVIRATSLALPLAALTALPACDLLNQAKSSVENATQIPLDVTQSTKISLDVNKLIGSAAGTTTPVDISQDITTPPAPVDLAKEQPDLAKYANGHIVTVEIKTIVVTPTTNTLTADMPALDLYFGPTDAKGAADSIKVATIPAITKGSTTAFNAQIDTAKMADAGTKYLAKLAFSQLISSKLTVKANSAVPGGQLDLKLDLSVHAVVSPL